MSAADRDKNPAIQDNLDSADTRKDKGPEMPKPCAACDTKTEEWWSYCAMCGYHIAAGNDHDREIARRAQAALAEYRAKGGYSLDEIKSELNIK